jgi:hypothetical protein
VSVPRRVVVDWDWGADGLWSVRSREERHAPAATGGQWVAYRRQSTPVPRPWGEILSNELLDALQSWNDACGERELRPPRHRTAEDELLEQRKVFLAGRVQQELGGDWEVLYTSHGAWRWVRPPRSWADR